MTSMFNTVWQQTQANSGTEYEALPEGKYECLVNNACVKTSKNGKTGVSWDFIVNNSNRHIFKWCRLREDNVKDFKVDVAWLKKDLETLGLECESYDLLNSVLKMSVGMRVLVELKYEGDYANVKILEELSRNAVNHVGSVEDVEEVEDDIPF